VNPDPSNQAPDPIRDVLHELRGLRVDVRALCDHAAAIRGVLARRFEPVASDRMLNEAHGDPELRPPGFPGGGHLVGRLMSEMSGDEAEMCAAWMQQLAALDEIEGALTRHGEPRAKHRRLAAARARGWAARLRAREARVKVSSTTDGVSCR